MTLVAIGTKISFMTIISGMAARAFARHIGGIFALVAASTAQTGVGTCKVKFGRTVMIECPQSPAIGCVAAAAPLAESGFMGIFCLVAVRTLTAGALEFVAVVAAGTGGYRMHAFQRKSRQFVIEVGSAAPVGALVAIGTVRHLRRSMNVIGAVTGLAFATHPVIQ